jgi:hypothetical protein
MFAYLLIFFLRNNPRRELRGAYEFHAVPSGVEQEAGVADGVDIPYL